MPGARNLAAKRGADYPRGEGLGRTRESCGVCGVCGVRFGSYIFFVFDSFLALYRKDHADPADPASNSLHHLPAGDFRVSVSA